MIGDPPDFYDLRSYFDKSVDDTHEDCDLIVTPRPSPALISLDCTTDSLSWFTDSDQNIGEYQIEVTKI